MISRRRLLGATCVAGTWLAVTNGPALSTTTDLQADARAGTSWWVAGHPEIGRMAPRIRETLLATAREFNWHGRTIKGNSAGAWYEPIFVRDLATQQPVLPFFLPPDYIRTPVEGFLASQDQFATRSGAVHSTLDAEDSEFFGYKATIVSDEESSLVHAAFAYFRCFGGPDWLNSQVDGRLVIDRLGDALEHLWINRRWKDSALLWRGHTTDWGDVKREAGEPTILETGDGLTISPFDQAWHYRALEDYATMLRAVMRPAQAAAARARAAQVRSETESVLWVPDRGHYQVHALIGDWTGSFDVGSIIPISNVLALYAGMAVPKQVVPILESTARAESIANTDRAGTTLSMPFPDHFFESIPMPGRQYQNGAVWDWWGGLQIVSEFEHGESERAIAHLDAAARYWDFADEIYEWFHLPSQSGQGSPQFAGAAATMAQGVIRGLFGVDIATDGYRVISRLGARNGTLRASRPEGDSIEIAQTVDSQTVTLVIRADTGTNGVAAIRLPAGWDKVAVLVNGQAVQAGRWRAGNDEYIGHWPIGQGIHVITASKSEGVGG